VSTRVISYVRCRSVATKNRRPEFRVRDGILTDSAKQTRGGGRHWLKKGSAKIDAQREPARAGGIGIQKPKTLAGKRSGESTIWGGEVCPGESADRERYCKSRKRDHGALIEPERGGEPANSSSENQQGAEKSSDGAPAKKKKTLIDGRQGGRGDEV